MKYLIPIIFLLILPLGLAIDYHPIIKVKNCVNVSIEVSSPEGIKTKDYNISNCQRQANNIDLWHCNCSGDYTLAMLTPNGLTKPYVVDINYTYQYKKRSGAWGNLEKSDWGTILPYNATTTTTTSTTTTTEKICEPEILKEIHYINITKNITQPCNETQVATTDPITNLEVYKHRVKLSLIIVGSLILLIIFTGFFIHITDKKKPEQPKKKVKLDWKDV